MYKFLGVLLSLCIICSCEKNDDSNVFSGFVETTPENEENIYLYNPKSIHNFEEGVRFQFIKKIKDGYIIQNGATDCKEKFMSMEGTYYSYDSQSTEETKGSTVEDTNDPHLNILISQVCKNYTPPQIMDKNGVNLKLIKQNYLDGLDDKSLSLNDVYIDKLYDGVRSIGNNQLRVILISISHAGNDCKACYPTTSAFVWKKEKDEWAPLQYESNLSNYSKGGYGHSPKWEWIQQGDKNTLLAIYHRSGMSQGYISFMPQIFYLSNEKGLLKALDDPSIDVVVNTYYNEELAFGLNNNDNIFKVVHGKVEGEFSLLYQYNEENSNINKEYSLKVNNDYVKYTGEVIDRIDDSSSEKNSFNKKEDKNKIFIISQAKNSGFMLQDSKASDSLDNKKNTKFIPNGASVIITGVSNDKKIYEVEYGNEKLYVPVESVAVFSN